MTSKQEERAGAAETTAAAAGGAASGAQAEVAAATTGGEAEMAAGVTLTAMAAMAAGDAEPPPPDNTRLRDSLEAIKTAVVWLVVINILTVLSPLLQLSLKWTLVVGLILTLSSFTIGGVAYLKARRTP